MDLYRVALFGHILGAVVVVGSGFVLPLIAGGAARAVALSNFREWAAVVLKVSKAAAMSAVLILISGLYMSVAGEWFRQPWVSVSLVLFVINGGLAGGVIDKHWKTILARAQEAGDGPVPSDVRTLTGTPKTHVVESFMLANDLVVVFLMTNKPGLTGTLIAVALGLALTGALAARGSRRVPATAVPA